MTKVTIGHDPPSMCSLRSIVITLLDFTWVENRGANAFVFVDLLNGNFGIRKFQSGDFFSWCTGTFLILYEVNALFPSR